ncbi:MAG TPA: DUF4169 family protein [Verrucomicrobiae bacterium]|jgi:hypothetical protein|nr:DUF4169 family protein [Verrucomicrobiae bacterium]
MGELVNLNKYRKQREKLATAKRAAENRVKFGRDKTDRSRVRAEKDREIRNLDDKLLD